MRIDAQEVAKLWDAILSLKDRREARAFFRDLLTEEEILDFAKRWQVARMLSAESSYVAIQARTGLSTRTIARISRWLSDGMGGYRLVIARLGHAHHAPASGKRV